MAWCEKLQFRRPGSGNSEGGVVEVMVCVPDMPDAVRDEVLGRIIAKYEAMGYKHLGGSTIGHVDEVRVAI